jgi:serine/threonine protein phosphatase PrpC
LRCDMFYRVWSKQMNFRLIAITQGDNSLEDRTLVWGDLCSLADGAGGTGILCGEWAEYILSKLPSAPISSFATFLDWFEQYAEDFVNQHEADLKVDLFKLRKFYEEGSACTLAALWRDGGKAYWLTYGDAHVFHIRESSFQCAPYQSREEFSRGTHLLNWKSLPNPEGVRFGIFTLESDSTLLLATDEVSKHLFFLRETEKDFHSALRSLYEAIETEDKFQRYIAAHPDIGEDDYTLIYIKV